MFKYLNARVHLFYTKQEEITRKIQVTSFFSMITTNIILTNLHTIIVCFKKLHNLTFMYVNLRILKC